MFGGLIYAMVALLPWFLLSDPHLIPKLIAIRVDVSGCVHRICSVIVLFTALYFFAPTGWWRQFAQTRAF